MHVVSRLLLYIYVQSTCVIETAGVRIYIDNLFICTDMCTYSNGSSGHVYTSTYPDSAIAKVMSLRIRTSLHTRTHTHTHTHSIRIRTSLYTHTHTHTQYVLEHLYIHTHTHTLPYMGVMYTPQQQSVDSEQCFVLLFAKPLTSVLMSASILPE